MVHLSRLSEEVILWSSEEFSFVKLRQLPPVPALCPKENPDVPELVRGSSMGHLQALLMLMKGPWHTTKTCKKTKNHYLMP